MNKLNISLLSLIAAFTCGQVSYAGDPEAPGNVVVEPKSEEKKPDVVEAPKSIEALKKEIADEEKKKEDNTEKLKALTLSFEEYIQPTIQKIMSKDKQTRAALSTVFEAVLQKMVESFGKKLAAQKPEELALLQDMPDDPLEARIITEAKSALAKEAEDTEKSFSF